MNGEHAGEEGSMISTTAEYALQAMAFLAGNGDRPKTISPGTGGVGGGTGSRAERRIGS
jgi:hypothetical protein